jgi:hypothetical protein
VDLFSPILMLPVLIAGVIVGWAVQFGRGRVRSLAVDEAAYPGLIRLRSATLTARRVGLVLGTISCLAVLPLGYLGRFALTGPAVASMVMIASILVGQHLVRRAAQTPGVAGLERRSWSDYPPWRAVFAAAAMLVLVALVAAYTTLAAAPDDLGRAGRALRTVCSSTVWFEGTTTEQYTAHISGPFPGSFYTAPMALALGALVLVAVVALMLVGRRPRNGSDAELVRVDDALRRITAEGIVASVGLGVAGSLVVVAASAYPQFGRAACASANVASSYLLAIMALGGLIFSLRCLITVVVPGDGARP